MRCSHENVNEHVNGDSVSAFVVVIGSHREEECDLRRRNREEEVLNLHPEEGSIRLSPSLLVLSQVLVMPAILAFWIGLSSKNLVGS